MRASRVYSLALLCVGATTLVLGACQPALQEPVAALTPVTAISDVTIIDFDGRRAQLIPGQTVLVEGDRITAIGSNLEIPAHATDIIGSEQFLLAGFTEMHGHVPPATSFGQLPERYLDDVLFLYVANGVTTVRGMLGYPHQLQLKQDIADGSRVGPTLYLAGPSFSGNSIESVEQATQRVIDQRDQGWDLLKIHPGLTLEQYQALATTAAAADMDFAGHVPAAVGLENALAAGQRTVDHLDGYLEHVDALQRPITAAEINQLVELSLRHGVTIVPTQALWQTLIGAGDADALMSYPELALVPQQVRQGWFDFLASPRTAYFNELNAQQQQQNRQQLLLALVRAGVPMVFGTDAPQLFSVPGFSIHREIATLQQAGLAIDEIIYSATIAAGDYFAEQDQFGRIAVGARADFMLLPGNPLTDASAIERLEGVMLRGQWLDRGTIDARLAEIQAAYQQPIGN